MGGHVFSIERRRKTNAFFVDAGVLWVLYKHHNLLIRGTKRQQYVLICYSIFLP